MDIWMNKYIRNEINFAAGDTEKGRVGGANGRDGRPLEMKQKRWTRTIDEFDNNADEKFRNFPVFQNNGSLRISFVPRRILPLGD